MQVSNNQSSLFRPFNGTADKGCVFGQPSLSPSVVNPFAPVRQPTTSVRGRNHARLGEIVQSLENINGSVSELLSIACIQEQLDTAFDDLERAKGQLKEVIHQFQAKGYMSNQQTRKKNCATDDLGKASRRIIALFQQLSAIQRQTPGSG
ncbi:hypothetical protein GGS20DRAFT_537698 [Poronia punctata]|nr:hypothetical protein GGS20DRAFT_537698 [Poronia punctata]